MLVLVIYYWADYTNFRLTIGVNDVTVGFLDSYKSDDTDVVKFITGEAVNSLYFISSFCSSSNSKLEHTELLGGYIGISCTSSFALGSFKV